MNLAMPLPRIENRLRKDPVKERDQLLQGLLQPQARINPKYFYDDRGCEIFTRICELEEYYPTRTEEAVFQRFANEIAQQLPEQAQWIDLGCGDCAKSRRWMEELAPRRLIGVDIAAEFLKLSLADVAAEHPRVECVGVVSDFTQQLDLAGLLAERPNCPPVFFYPGSSIGNFPRPDALQLLQAIRSHCTAHGRLLIGVDLIKPARVLEAAYDDAKGVTAEFNLNVLNVVNRELDADFRLEDFRHEAMFDRQESRIEMRLVARHDLVVKLDNASRAFQQGEHILTEYSHKYTPEGFAAMLEEAGFAAPHFWTDDRGWFGVFLAGPA
ncbi:MAG: L-histidine N(alpha)-methyltransferase [Pseudomonas sp.]|nr:L-histidine N(alpha)-methyltransferase [Pseudomonas sp.]